MEKNANGNTFSRCLFGAGTAVVIGLPPAFDLSASIGDSLQVRLATAFAHWSGWEMIARSVRNSRAALRLLTGLDFCQTEPEVLKDWLKLGEEKGALARLYIGQAATFHPKVLIVSSHTKRFAIVGSGNLSAGGFRDNVECSVFIDHEAILDELEAWFDGIFADESATHSLTGRGIEEYEPKFQKMRKRLASIRAAQREIQSKLAEAQIGEATTSATAPKAFEQMLLTVLRSLGDRAAHASADIRSRVLGDGIQYSTRDKNWLAHCLVKLQEALVIRKSQKGDYLITARGRRLLEQELPSITLQTLKRYPEYIQAQSDRGKNAAKTRALRRL